MRKWFLLVLCLFCCSVSSAQTPPTPSQAREAEWKSYAVPNTNFARQVSPAKEFLFRVPADWKQQGTELVFDGPQSSSLRVIAQRIPDGYPFQEYFAAVLQGVRDVPGAAEATTTRKTQLQDLEAREILIEITDTEGEPIRSASWVTVSGPLAVMFTLQVPEAHAAEIEPVFKAVVQSVVFLSRDYAKFEALRSSIIQTSAPGPINDIESIVSVLTGATPDRDAAINRLAPLFSSHADVAVDLLLDRRPLVRAAAVQALARSDNKALKPFLWEMIDDEELLVAEAAARSVASAPDVVAETVRHSLSGFDTETIARIWPFMPDEKRAELLQMIFKKTAVPQKTNPPPVAAKKLASVSVKTIEMVPVKPGAPVPDITVAISDDPNVQIGALTLLGTITPEEFRLPLARLIASNYNPLIAVGLQVANDRLESLPVDSLVKLVASSDEQVSKLAAQSLGLSASVADIPRIEALISKDGAKPKKALDEELKLSIKKVRFRQEINAAKSPAEARAVISKALSDSTLDEFAWRYDCEATSGGCAPERNKGVKPGFVVKPFAENLLPKKVRHYIAIPNPGQSVQRFYETLNGLQMDSPKAQASLVLMMAYIRQSLAAGLSAPADAATLIEYTGIDPESPIALTSWTAENALDSTNRAERKAIVLRVKDRARFERAIQQIQHDGPSFTDMTDFIAIGTRAIAAAPAILPLSLEVIRSVGTSKSKGVTGPLLKYDFVTEREWNGLRIKAIEHRSITPDWQLTSGTTYIVSIGNTVILTPDLATLRDLLSRANNETGGQLLADNAEFREAIQRGGDVMYFSDLNAVMAEVAQPGKGPSFKINESGVLNIANASWENSHRLVFEESDWSKPLLPFHPKELAAPRDLLPASTIAYYLMKVDLATAFPKLVASVPAEDLQNASKLWSIDFAKEVLPELGPECGVVILALPSFDDFKSGTWAVFCKMKSTKLSDALAAGKLLTGVGPAKEFAEVKFDRDSYFVAARSGFLVVSNNENGLAALDGKSRLSETRDYSRAVEKVPAGIVAFGGYNLEAAIAAANKTPAEEGFQAQVFGIISSVASAFHSQNFYATATAGTVEAHSSVAMDREGRYPVADFAVLPRGTNITFVTLEPAGLPITDQNRLSALVLKVRSKAPGPIENIRDDVKTAAQTVEHRSPTELVLTVSARKGGADTRVELPVKDPEFAAFLKATPEIAAEDEQVKEQARKIAGSEKDAWTVARKLADWTFKNLEWKHVQSADAAQTLATREADCSEFSALFVAMARSLGLPARMVSGLAYSGNSFGGHAWVEVWAGKWIELDPTWGTDFVDATHIRNNSNTLVTSAALNLVDLEVLETRRAVAEFQKSATALTQHLLTAIPTGAQSDIEAAIDLPMLTDEFMGAGAWSKMNDREREKMWSAYRRTLNEIVSGYGNQSSFHARLRLLNLEEKGNSANAICLLSPSDLLLKLRLARRNDLWQLVEVEQSDTSLLTVADTFQPTIAAIESARAGQKAVAGGLTEFARVLLLTRRDADKAIATADGALKLKPNDKGLRLLKALALRGTPQKIAESIKLLRELSNEGFAPAVHKLAEVLRISLDEKDKNEALALYERYVSLEPFDPRGFSGLADTQKEVATLAQAEVNYRKAIDLNPADSEGYISLIFFLRLEQRFSDMRAVLAAFDQHKDTDENLLEIILRRWYYNDGSSDAEKLAAIEPGRVKLSSDANLILGRINLDARKYATAFNYLNAAAQLDKKSSAPHIVMSTLHRKQSRWAAALKAADVAIGIDRENAEAHYERACALARLGRLKDAMSAIQKVLELDPDYATWMEDEADLKPLASLPEFKRLLAEPEKP